jgi:exonuclease VII small subunit
MWKRQDDGAEAQQPKVTSKDMFETPEMSLESARETLIEAYRNRNTEMPNSAVGPQKVPTSQPSVPTSMATYSEAVDEFTKHASVLIEQLPLLSKARDAYEQAMKASAGLRRELDARDEHLRSLMGHLEDALDAAPDRKKPEPAKVGAIGANNQNTRANRFV